MNANQAQMLAWMNVMLDVWMKGMEVCVGNLEAKPEGQGHSSA
jgi:hypothetical protein